MSNTVFVKFAVLFRNLSRCFIRVFKLWSIGKVFYSVPFVFQLQGLLKRRLCRRMSFLLGDMITTGKLAVIKDGGDAISGHCYALTGRMWFEAQLPLVSSYVSIRKRDLLICWVTGYHSFIKVVSNSVNRLWLQDEVLLKKYFFLQMSWCAYVVIWKLVITYCSYSLLVASCICIPSVC